MAMAKQYNLLIVENLKIKLDKIKKIICEFFWNMLPQKTVTRIQKYELNSFLSYTKLLLS